MSKLQMLIVTIQMCVATYIGFAYEGWLAKLSCIFAGFFIHWIVSDLLEERGGDDGLHTVVR